MVVEGNGNRLVSINHWVDAPEIQVYDGDLELLRTLPLSMVSRAVGADFRRNVVAGGEQLTARCATPTLDAASGIGN